MSYTPLKSVFHRSNAEEHDIAYRQRVGSSGVLTWDFPVGDWPLFCMITPELMTLLMRIQSREADVQRISGSLPGQAIIQYFQELVTDEVLATNSIEGVSSTRAEVHHALSEARRNRAHSTARLTELVGLYLDLFSMDSHPPRTLGDLRSIYDAVTRGEIDEHDQPDGQLFRRGPVHVTDGARLRHQGVTPELAIHELLAVMSAAGERQDAPPLLRAVVGHFMFEYVHPFYDGNGRTGRYLLSRDLSRALGPLTALRVSRKVSEEKTAYVKAFEVTEDRLNRADVTLFVLPMLRLIDATQSELLEDLAERNRDLDALISRVAELRTARTLGVDEAQLLSILGQAHLFGGQGLDLETLTLYSDRGKATVRKRLKELEARGLVLSVGKPLDFRFTREGQELLGLR